MWFTISKLNFKTVTTLSTILIQTKNIQNGQKDVKIVYRSCEKTDQNPYCVRVVLSYDCVRVLAVDNSSCILDIRILVAVKVANLRSGQQF